jgi:hypothetical protein
MMARSEIRRKTMKKAITIISVCVLVLSSGELLSQEATIPATMDLLFNRIMVNLKGGQIHIGLLAGIMDRGLVLRIQKKDVVIQYDELEHVVIERKKGGGVYIPGGMLLGLYLGNIVAYRSHDTPPFHLEKAGILGMAFWNVVFAAAGGGLGYLGSTLVEKDEKAFDFTGEEKARLKQWKHLQWFVTGNGGSRTKKIHLTLQGGYVSNWTTDKYRSQLENNGYYVYDYSNDYREVTKVSLLRKVHLTYSPFSRTEFGVAANFLGEPSITASYYRSSLARFADQSFDTRGYYAVAEFHPFSPGKLGSFDWSVGIGAGLAEIKFDFFSETFGGAQYGWNRVRVDDFHLSRRMFSGVVFTELKVGIQKGISLGVMADYVYIPAVKIPEFPGAGIPGQDLNLGNASFGLLLGFHF